MSNQTTHHAEAILRAATPAGWMLKSSGERYIWPNKPQGLVLSGPQRLEPLYTAEAILAAVREAMEAKWLPIEDAPRDLTWLLCWGPDAGHGVFRLTPNMEWAEEPEYTHFRPLPTPPRGE